MPVVLLPFLFVFVDIHGPGVFDLAFLLVASVTSLFAFYNSAKRWIGWLALIVTGLVTARLALVVWLIDALGDVRTAQLLGFLLPAIAGGVNFVILLLLLLFPED